MSGSSTSPFGTLNTSSTTSGVSPFGAVKPAQAPLSGFGGTEANKSETTSSSGFGGATTTATTASGFGSIGASISGSSGFGILGGSTLGGGFGSGFGRGAKLTSFAASGGDAKLVGGAPMRNFGARAEEDEDEDNEDNGEDGEDDAKANGVEETDARFHQQEGTCAIHRRDILIRANAVQWKPEKKAKRQSSPAVLSCSFGMAKPGKNVESAFSN